MMPEKKSLMNDLIRASVELNKLTQRLMYELQTHKGDLSPAIMCRLVENLARAKAIMEANCAIMVREMYNCLPREEDES